MSDMRCRRATYTEFHNSLNIGPDCTARSGASVLHADDAKQSAPSQDPSASPTTGPTNPDPGTGPVAAETDRANQSTRSNGPASDGDQTMKNQSGTGAQQSTRPDDQSTGSTGAQTRAEEEPSRPAGRPERQQSGFDEGQLLGLTVPTEVSRNRYQHGRVLLREASPFRH